MYGVNVCARKVGQASAGDLAGVMLGALGSRGLCSAPLCAEILASQMSEEPIPMDASTLAALNPNRLWVRKLLKGKAVK